MNTLKRKYVRVQGRQVGDTGKPVGLFGVCWHFRDRGLFNEDDLACYSAIEKWFLENTPIPDFYDDPGNECATWFKTETAGPLIERIKPLMNLMDKYEHPYDIIYTDSPGEIMYEDEYQVGVR